MSEVLLTIDGTEIRAGEGMTVLEAAQSAGIYIPTLCRHEKLQPYGCCRICTVEADLSGRTNLVAACLYPVEKNLVVRTRSEKVDKIRKTLLELALAHAPDSDILLELAREYGADRERFAQRSSFCILCGLCVRYCTEVRKKNAIAFVDRGAKRQINFIPQIASRECWNCKECFPLCPTSALQANFFLTEALMPSPLSLEARSKE